MQNGLWIFRVNGGAIIGNTFYCFAQFLHFVATVDLPPLCRTHCLVPLTVSVFGNLYNFICINQPHCHSPPYPPGQQVLFSANSSNRHHRP
jgi:hypothetical protein